MYVGVEFIEGMRLLQVRLLRDTLTDENPSVRRQQAVFMLRHTHIRRRWANPRKASPAAATVAQYSTEWVLCDAGPAGSCGRGVCWGRSGPPERR
jgi:hypothetical protein